MIPAPYSFEVFAVKELLYLAEGKAMLVFELLYFARHDFVSVWASHINS